jgi:hypothetical protein
MQNNFIYCGIMLIYVENARNWLAPHYHFLRSYYVPINQTSQDAGTYTSPAVL